MPDLVSGQGEQNAPQHWEANPNEWDSLNVNGERWRGLWYVEPSGVELDLDRKKAKGKHGSRKRNQGRKSPTAKIIGQLKAAEWTDVEPKLQRVLPAALDGLVTPITMQHPALRIVGLTQLFVSKWTIKPPKSAAEFMTVELDVEQFVPETKDVKRSVSKYDDPDQAEQERADDYLAYLQQKQFNDPFPNYYDEPDIPSGASLEDALGAFDYGPPEA